MLAPMAQGYTNKEMGPMLGISDRTVDDHRAAIITKTRTNGTAQLIALSRGEST
ncbi:LuxR C-terminal-related transcriptional regulator (plasmid) [Novosphingobium resinovorum]|nr:LuxR C-terminal-related transcriptional regulator [Novosphingobium resinovorum]WJM29866.1 LuxR C-terminal-related transcriptional regulator [Novosphingobium resinovorum]